MALQQYPSDMLTRYMAIKLILDSGQFPSAPSDTGVPQNVKTIFANSDQNSLTVNATITKASGLEPNSAVLTIYGMTIEDCNQFSRFNQTYPLNLYENAIEIYAGYSVDANGFPPLVYKGQVYLAGGNFNDPSRPFTIVSYSGIYNQNLISSITNPQGDVALDTLFQGIVQKSPDNLTYQSNGVKGNTNCPIYSGSWISQLNYACKDYGYQFKLDDDKVLVTAINNAYSENLLTINKDTGMIGYPIIVDLGIDVRYRFNPSVQFGQKVKVESTLQQLANGTWYINGMSHTLQNRGAKWESAFKLNPLPFNLPVTE